MADLDVTLSMGTMRGSQHAGIRRFLGVPYAAAPVGGLRLRPPGPVQPWSGRRDAVRYGPTSPKGDYPTFAQHLLPEVRIPGDGWLNLNLWAPQESAGPAHPVLVWIHGGSFTNGSGSAPEYDGTSFARDGIVCVTINYRLGAEGFTLLDGGTPNLALLDMIAALTWVRQEIAAFGGDPDRVTLAGESAGAMAVTALLAAPAATGLFQQAIAQSGAGSHVMTSDAAGEIAGELAAELEVPPSRRAFATIPSQPIVEAVSRIAASVASGDRARWNPEVLAKSLPFAPVIDGQILPRFPHEAIAAGASTSLPLLVSMMRDEYRLFVIPTGMASAITHDAVAARADLLGVAPDQLSHYRDVAVSNEPSEVLIAMMSDQRFQQPARDLVAARSASAAGTFFCRFDGINRTDNDDLGSCHTTDVPLVFDTAQLPGLRDRMGTRSLTAETEVAHGAWVTFIKTGNPGWPACANTNSPMALLSGHIELRQA